MAKRVSFSIRWVISESRMHLQGETKGLQGPSHQSEWKRWKSWHSSEKKIIVFLWVNSFRPPAHSCSDSDLHNFLSGRHDKIFNDSELANIHSELSKIPELLYTSGDKSVVEFQTAQLELCKKLSVYGALYPGSTEKWTLETLGWRLSESRL